MIDDDVAIPSAAVHRRRAGPRRPTRSSHGGEVELEEWTRRRERLRLSRPRSRIGSSRSRMPSSRPRMPQRSTEVPVDRRDAVEDQPTTGSIPSTRCGQRSTRDGPESARTAARAVERVIPRADVNTDLQATRRVRGGARDIGSADGRPPARPAPGHAPRARGRLAALPVFDLGRNASTSVTASVLARARSSIDGSRRRSPAARASSRSVAQGRRRKDDHHDAARHGAGRRAR